RRTNATGVRQTPWYCLRTTVANSWHYVSAPRWRVLRLLRRVVLFRKESARRPGGEFSPVLRCLSGKCPCQSGARLGVRPRRVCAYVVRHEHRPDRRRSLQPGGVAARLAPTASPNKNSTMSVLYLTEADIQQLLTMELALEAVEVGLKKVAIEEAVNIPR